jgi:large subunit ribosomal protein L16
MTGISDRGTTLEFGDFGLKALEAGWLPTRRIEAARRVLTRYTKKGGRIWIRIFPDKPITKKPAETRMGGGKGDVADYVAVVRPGRVLFEMGGIPKKESMEALALAAGKLGIKTRVISK